MQCSPLDSITCAVSGYFSRTSPKVISWVIVFLSFAILLLYYFYALNRASVSSSLVASNIIKLCFLWLCLVPVHFPVFFAICDTDTAAYACFLIKLYLYFCHCITLNFFK